MIKFAVFMLLVIVIFPLHRVLIVDDMQNVQILTACTITNPFDFEDPIDLFFSYNAPIF